LARRLIGARVASGRASRRRSVKAWRCRFKLAFPQEIATEAQRRGEERKNLSIFLVFSFFFVTLRLYGQSLVSIFCHSILEVGGDYDFHEIKR
jgi:hypothetical protein